MFQWLRRMVLPIMFFALLAFVGGTILMDLTSNAPGGITGNYAARINGEEIPWEVYNRTYQELYRTESQNSQVELPESKLRQLEEQAWNELLQDRLLMQEADKLDLVVTDDEVYQFLRYNPPPYLQSVPQFQTDGNFDYQKYFGAMLDEQADPFWRSVEPMVRADIKKLKLQQMIIQAAHVSEEEVKQSYINKEEKVTVAMINVPTSKFNTTLIDIPATDILEYYNEHQEDYKVDDQAVIDLVSIRKEASETDWERAESMIRSVYDSVTTGSNFEDMARLFSMDGSAANGGDLGWFESGRMVGEFNELAFSMKEGEISEPFKTQFGWHIIKHFGYRTTKKVPRGKTEEEDVREAKCSHILRKVDPSTETLDAIYQQLARVASIAEEIGFEKAAEEAGLEIRTTRPFLKRGPIEFLGNDASMLTFAFDNPVNSISDVFDNPSLFGLARIAKRIPAGVSALEDISTRIEADMRNQLYKQMCLDTALAIYEAILAGADFEAAASSDNADFVELDPFARVTYVKAIGRDPVAIGAAFSLKEPGQISKPVMHGLGAVMFKLTSRSSLDLTKFTEIRDSLNNDVLLRKQQELYSRWFQGIVESAEIDNNISRLNQDANAS